MRKTLLLMFVLWANAVSAQDVPDKNECEMNADLASYLITISAYCGYQRDSKYESILAEISKQCISLYGEPLTANASMAAIHSVKAEMADTGRSAACLRAYSEYREFFD